MSLMKGQGESPSLDDLPLSTLEYDTTWLLECQTMYETDKTTEMLNRNAKQQAKTCNAVDTAGTEDRREA
uniref:Uncharacterized protein n=1 Tax=Arion vulgaris TaxID=1028688 RepID=A0A0B7A9V7_9EUPU